MNKKQKIKELPPLTDEMIESGADLSGYFSNPRRVPAEQVTQKVNVDFPPWVVEALDAEANRRGMARQALIKYWIVDCLEGVKFSSLPERSPDVRTLSEQSVGQPGAAHFVHRQSSRKFPRETRAYMEGSVGKSTQVQVRDSHGEIRDPVSSIAAKPHSAKKTSTRKSGSGESL